MKAQLYARGALGFGIGTRSKLACHAKLSSPGP